MPPTNAAAPRLTLGRKEFFYHTLVLPSPRKTILVVEDDRALREVYRAALMMSGYTVVAVEDGIDALKHVEKDLPNLIVLDLALPRLGDTMSSANSPLAPRPAISRSSWLRAPTRVLFV
jgi:PleD family two-component response regulator